MLAHRTHSMISAAVWGLLACALLAGCGPSATSICDQFDECEGYSQRDFDECVDNIEDIERDAEREDCLPEFDELLACTEDTFDCDDGRAETRCGDEVNDLFRCVN